MCPSWRNSWTWFVLGCPSSASASLTGKRPADQIAGRVSTSVKCITASGTPARLLPAHTPTQNRLYAAPYSIVASYTWWAGPAASRNCGVQLLRSRLSQVFGFRGRGWFLLVPSRGPQEPSHVATRPRTPQSADLARASKGEEWIEPASK